MQGELGALAHRTDEQADTDHGDQHPVGAWETHLGQVTGLGKGFGVVERASVSRNQANAQDKTEVTHTVDQKGLHVGKSGGRLVEPETDQQVRHQAHGFPTEEKLQQVVAHDEHQHRKREQRDVRKEAVVAFVFFHVANGVDVHHERHEGHHHHHHRGEAVHQEADFHLEVTNDHPCVQGLVEVGTVQRHTLECHRRQDKSDQHTQNGQGVAESATDPVAAKRRAQDTGQQGTGQRCHGHGQQG